MTAPTADEQIIYDRTKNLVENEDFQLIIPEDPSKMEDQWDVRFLTGDFPETVVRFDTVKFSEDGESLSYNFNIISSPESELDEDDVMLQQNCANVLVSLLERALEVQAKAHAEQQAMAEK